MKDEYFDIDKAQLRELGRFRNQNESMDNTTNICTNRKKKKKQRER